MITKKLKKQVRGEAKRLRAMATPEELARLDFANFNPTSTYGCIYGQMTGDCFTPRAYDLIQQCTESYYDELEIRDIESAETDIPSSGGTHVRNWSPIEVYILQDDAKIENLLKYLKGEVKTLRL